MVDSLGYRMKFGVVAPSTNTSVQPEYEKFCPVGVTNHFARIHIPDDPVNSDMDFQNLMVNIRASLMEAVDRVCLLYTSPSPRDLSTSRMPSSA